MKSPYELSMLSPVSLLGAKDYTPEIAKGNSINNIYIYIYNVHTCVCVYCMHIYIYIYIGKCH